MSQRSWDKVKNGLPAHLRTPCPPTPPEQPKLGRSQPIRASSTQAPVPHDPGDLRACMSLGTSGFPSPCSPSLNPPVPYSTSFQQTQLPNQIYGIIRITLPFLLQEIPREDTSVLLLCGIKKMQAYSRFWPGKHHFKPFLPLCTLSKSSACWECLNPLYPGRASTILHKDPPL